MAFGESRLGLVLLAIYFPGVSKTCIKHLTLSLCLFTIRTGRSPPVMAFSARLKFSPAALLPGLSAPSVERTKTLPTFSYLRPILRWELRDGVLFIAQQRATYRGMFGG